jgi:hypothetical protein
MSQIRVWANAVGSDPTGSTEFIVKDMQQNKVVVDTHSTNSALPQGDWFTVNFKPDWMSQGKFYLLMLRSEVSGPRFAYSLKPEYPAGKLFENDQALDQDIIFQTGCVAGLEKLRLPSSP